MRVEERMMKGVEVITEAEYLTYCKKLPMEALNAILDESYDTAFPKMQKIWFNVKWMSKAEARKYLNKIRKKARKAVFKVGLPESVLMIKAVGDSMIDYFMDVFNYCGRQFDGDKWHDIEARFLAGEVKVYDEVNLLKGYNEISKILYHATIYDYAKQLLDDLELDDSKSKVNYLGLSKFLKDNGIVNIKPNILKCLRDNKKLPDDAEKIEWLGTGNDAECFRLQMWPNEKTRTVFNKCFSFKGGGLKPNHVTKTQSEYFDLLQPFF